MTPEQAAVLERVKSTLPNLQKIHSTCRTPSLTFGILHENEILLQDSIGHRDNSLTLPSNPDTIYMLGSCSKMFTSAAAGLLVAEGKLSWTDPISKYIPEFNPTGDPRIGREADIIDCLRHTTGLASPTLLTVGPRGTIVSDEEDLIGILNAMPTATPNGGEQRFNREWLYNNAAVGLVAIVIERITQQRFVDFVRERLLIPLGMTRTALTRAEIEADANIAVPCTKLRDGSFCELPDCSWPCDTHPPLLAGMGMRSNISDMLTWCRAVLDAERSETDPSYKSIVHNNPLKQMTCVRRGYWTRPPDDPEFSSAATYGMGWFRVDIPSSKLSSFSGNALSQGPEHKLHLDYILGRDWKGEGKQALTAVGHTGGMRGSIFSVYTFPETMSAVVTATNGRDQGDASDFAAQVLIQALFDLTPLVDVHEWAFREAELARTHYRGHIEGPWEEGRRPKDLERDRMIYVGVYVGFNERFRLSIIVADDDPAETTLAVVFNGRVRSTCPLVFYQTDVYSFFLPNEDYAKTQAITAREYEQMLLRFRIDTEGGVQGLYWKWNTEANEEPAWMPKITL